MMKNGIKKVLLWGLLLWPSCIFANNDFVIQYFDRFNSLEANFTQTIKNKKQAEKSSGFLRLQKRSLGKLSPKFSFDYTSPYKQRLISDGVKLWHYDEDLMQVVIKPMQSINNNPLLVILLGERPLDTYFDIRKQGNERYILTPKGNKADLEFRSITINFNKGMIHSFLATDLTGQDIIIELSNIKQNPIFDDKYFKFTAPKGVDVINETR